MPASNAHGFTWENSIRTSVFQLPEETNNTDTHDIPKELNPIDDNENVSIKCTGSTTICCGSLKRFFSYDFSETNTIICIHYRQLPGKKRIRHIYEIAYTREMHQHLFGTLTQQEIDDYENVIKSIPKGTVPREVKKQYVMLKKQLQDTHKMRININPKVDSKSQRRVQCSIPNFLTSLQPFIKSVSDDSSVNTLRGKHIPLEIVSNPRIRHKKQQTTDDLTSLFQEQCCISK